MRVRQPDVHERHWGEPDGSYKQWTNVLASTYTLYLRIKNSTDCNGWGFGLGDRQVGVDITY